MCSDPGGGGLSEGFEGHGLCWLEEHWVRGPSVEGLGAGNQEERGQGQSSVQRRICRPRTEGVLSNPELAAAGRGAARLALPSSFLARQEGEGSRVPPSLAALGAVTVAKKQGFI